MPTGMAFGISEQEDPANGIKLPATAIQSRVCEKGKSVKFSSLSISTEVWKNVTQDYAGCVVKATAPNKFPK